jgi:hypothetical protein
MARARGCGSSLRSVQLAVSRSALRLFRFWVPHTQQPHVRTHFCDRGVWGVPILLIVTLPFTRLHNNISTLQQIIPHLCHLHGPTGSHSHTPRFVATRVQVGVTLGPLADFISSNGWPSAACLPQLIELCGCGDVSGSESPDVLSCRMSLQ